MLLVKSSGKIKSSESIINSTLIAMKFWWVKASRHWVRDEGLLEMKSSTTMLTTPEPISFLKEVELKTLQGEGEPTTWQSLQLALTQAHSASEVLVVGNQPLPPLSNLVVLAAAALELGETRILRELEESQLLAKFISDWRQTLDEGKVAQEAVGICVLYDLENVACYLVRKCTKLPLWVIHRAGERGMLQLLKAISDFKVSVCPSRVLYSVVCRFKQLVHKPSQATRFNSSLEYLLAEDVLKWSILSGGERKVREMLASGLLVTDEVFVRVLITEGLVKLLEELIEARKVRLSMPATLALLSAGQLSLLITLVEVTAKIEAGLLLCPQNSAVAALF